LYDLPGGHLYTPPPPPLPTQYHPYPNKHHRYDGHAQYVPQPFPIAHGGYVPYRTILNVPMAPTQSSGGGAGVIQVVHTDRRGDEAQRSYEAKVFQLLHHGYEYVEKE
jgi:hypothetical protein